MISKLGQGISKCVERIVPDPFVIAILLTIITAIIALILGDFENENRVTALLDSWRDGKGGIWKLLAFSMQMCLVLVTGYALATTKLVRLLIDSLANIPNGTASAAALVGFIACVGGLLNWGLGLIVGALLAREVGFALQRKNIQVHYPLIAAAGYMGLLVWHGGLSGSAPLSMTTIDGAAKVVPEQYLEHVESILLSESIGSSMNYIISGGLLVLVPIMLFLLAPKNQKDIRPIDMFEVDCGHTEEDLRKAASLPDKLNQSTIIAWLLGVPLLLALGRHIYVSGIDRVGLNEITVFMLGLGLLLHGSPIGYMQEITRGAKGCAGIIIQFPLYAGIMAMMVASGLMGSLTELMVASGTQETIPLMTMISAGVVNLFVPSGGGQWAIQAPIALESGLQTGVAPGTMVMAVAYGDQLTNMLQPFWALPLLAITGVRARDIVGYTAVVMVAAAIWIALGLLLFG
ncbi:MAG: TIGR00366 family protein [Phycisphaerales bacterium]|jgi:short-chain fatty acids transporter|nr:TIGR00366 family protein [Phycisphaerales bacterium]